MVIFNVSTREMLIVIKKSLEHPNGGDQDTLRLDLHKLLSRCHELLPDPNLRRGEVQFSRDRPVATSGGLDVYEGIYLGGEKVTIKMISRFPTSSNSTRRFLREVDIWRKVHSVDQGKHLVPFYGFNELDSRGMW